MDRKTVVSILLVISFVNISLSEDIYEILLKIRDNSVSKDCSKDLLQIQRGIENSELWALKVLDASGKSSSGFINGNNFWLGSETVCKLLDHPVEVPLPWSVNRRMGSLEASVGSKVPVDYRIIFASHSSHVQFHSEIFNFVGLHIGLCLPKSCSEKDVQTLVESVLSTRFKNESLLYGEVEFKTSKKLELRENFFTDPWTLALIIVVSIFVISTLVATCFSSAGKFNKVFSIQENVKTLFSLENDENTFLSLHALRFIFTLWMIIAHSNLYTFGAVDNIQFSFTFSSDFKIQPVFSTFIAVETFFVLGGFLVSYSFFQTAKQEKKSRISLKSTFSKIIMRFIRFNIGFSIILLIATVVGMFLKDTTKFLLVEDLEMTCKEFGWRNMLLIQNMFRFSEVCVSWSWYIAADFQLFAISNLLLWIYGWNEKLGKILFSSIFVMSSLVCGLLGLRYSFTFSVDRLFSAISEIYFPFYMHIGPYFCGIFTGFYLSKHNGMLKWSQSLVNILWMLCLTALLTMTFFFHLGRAESFYVSFLFPAVGRTLWSLCIAFIILTLCSQYGKGSITRLWNSKLFLPLARFSFSAYILNPLIVLIFVLSGERAYHYDFYTSTVMTVGFIFTTYFFALLFMLFFEMPITNLVSLLVDRKRSKTD